MLLYLIRHGETVFNKEFRFLGRTDVGLSEQGLMQAKALAERLKGENISAIYSSSLKRALETAHEISRYHDSGIIVLESLREIDFGDWEGMTYNEIDTCDGEHLKEWIANPTEIAIPGGESWHSFEARIRHSIDEIVNRDAEGGVAVVSHGGPIKLLMAYFYKKDMKQFKEFWPSPGGLSIIELVDDTAQVVIENEIVYE